MKFSADMPSRLGGGDNRIKSGNGTNCSVEVRSLPLQLKQKTKLQKPTYKCAFGYWVLDF
jgi:hypothetical protein